MGRRSAGFGRTVSPTVATLGDRFPTDSVRSSCQDVRDPTGEDIFVRMGKVGSVQSWCRFGGAERGVLEAQTTPRRCVAGILIPWERKS